jgi:hypothetical protein
VGRLSRRLAAERQHDLTSQRNFQLSQSGFVSSPENAYWAKASHAGCTEQAAATALASRLSFVAAPAVQLSLSCGLVQQHSRAAVVTGNPHMGPWAAHASTHTLAGSTEDQATRGRTVRTHAGCQACSSITAALLHCCSTPVHPQESAIESKNQLVVTGIRYRC